MSNDIAELVQAIERLHDCKAEYLESTAVSESFQGQPVWQGEVHTFAISDHPKADTCYAWSSPIEGSDRRRYYAVLHVPPVDSPLAAVRAAIVADHKGK